jgi:hypothetical protein
MRRNPGLLLLAFCVLATVLFAQVVITSTIVGTVTDPQGAMIPDARVTLHNLDTGVQWTAATNGSGDYQFPNLIAGRYKVEIIKEGFAKAVSTAVPLENGTTRRVNVTLKVGQSEQVVEVTGAAALVKTDDANVSEVIENKFVRDLPIEGRNWLNYAQIVPGFNTGTSDQSRIAWGLASATSNGAKQLNVGGTEYGVGYYIDGLNNNDNWVEGPVTNVNVDAVQEVKAEVINYSAEYGRDVGQISLTTKSGTNNLHGSAYEFFQNAGMNANDRIDRIRHPRTPYHQNQYGFPSAPGLYPQGIQRQKQVVFFASAEWFRNRSNGTKRCLRSDGAGTNGDFSEWQWGTSQDPAAMRRIVELAG